MLVMEQEKLKHDIQEWIAQEGRDRTRLLPVLQKIQNKYHCVSSTAMQIAADELGIHPVEVQSVVSFYAFLDHRPKGKFVIRLCRTISCDLADKDRVAKQLENDLGISFGETTPDGKFTLEWANCLGMCDQGPAMLVNDEVYTRVTPTQVHEILEVCRKTFAIYALENHTEVHR